MAQVIGGVTYYLHSAINVYVAYTNPQVPAAGVVGAALDPVTRSPLVLREPTTGDLLATWTTDVAGVAPPVLSTEPQFLADFGSGTNLTVSNTVDLGTAITDGQAAKTAAEQSQQAAQSSELSAQEAAALVASYNGLTQTGLDATLAERDQQYSALTRNVEWDFTANDFKRLDREPGQKFRWFAPGPPTNYPGEATEDFDSWVAFQV